MDSVNERIAQEEYYKKVQREKELERSREELKKSFQRSNDKRKWEEMRNMTEEERCVANLLMIMSEAFEGKRGKGTMETIRKYHLDGCDCEFCKENPLYPETPSGEKPMRIKCPKCKTIQKIRYTEREIEFNCPNCSMNLVFKKMM